MQSEMIPQVCLPRKSFPTCWTHEWSIAIGHTRYSEGGMFSFLFGNSGDSSVHNYSHIFDKRMVFRRCVIYNVLSCAPFRSTSCHTQDRRTALVSRQNAMHYDVAPSWLYIVNFLLQSEQDSFSPVWQIRCFIKPDLVINFLLQSSQANGLSPI